MISRLTENKKSLYIAIFSSFGAAGLAASQLVYTSIFETFNGKTWILAIPALILGAFLLQKKYLNGAETQKSGQPARFRLFLEFFKIPSMRLLYISQVCNQAVAWALIFLLPDILKERGYSDWTVFGGGHLSYVLGGAFLLIPSGYIADKFSSRSVITGASVLGFIFLYTFLLLPNLSDFAVLGLLFCTGAAISIVNPVSIALGNKLQPSHPGMVSAFLMGCVWCVSEAIGPGGGGLLTKIFDEDAPARALMLIGVLFPVGLAAVSQLPQEENQLQEI
jgi:FSR family fosmidomycin resistance protein-like MFS transporter